jgi:hypothetical protein
LFWDDELFLFADVRKKVNGVMRWGKVDEGKRVSSGVMK